MGKGAFGRVYKVPTFFLHFNDFCLGSNPHFEAHSGSKTDFGGRDDDEPRNLDFVDVGPPLEPDRVGAAFLHAASGSNCTRNFKWHSGLTAVRARQEVFELGYGLHADDVVQVEPEIA